MKLSIIVGHTQARSGAYSDSLLSSEYDWNSDLAARIAAIQSAVQVKVFFRDGIGIAGAYANSDSWGANASVELHFNSSHSPLSSGTGVLYHPGSTRGRRLATFLFETMSGQLSLSDWPRNSGGVVTPFQASGQQRRGERSLSAGRAPAALIEPFFGSNPDDSAVANANKDGLAHAIVAAAQRFAG